MSKKRNNNASARHNRRVSISLIATCNLHNQEIVEGRVRRANLQSKQPKSFIDPERERSLYKEPTISKPCADTIIRSLQPRVKLTDYNEFY